MYLEEFKTTADIIKEYEAPADATEQQNWLVFHGLARQIDQEEFMAAMDYRNMLDHAFMWSTAERVAESLGRMRQCHELRAKLQPILFSKHH